MSKGRKNKAEKEQEVNHWKFRFRRNKDAYFLKKQGEA